jgi:hypothetical protein
MLPNPLILGLPLQGWLGIIIFSLIVLQIGVGMRIIKLPFYFHKRIIPSLVIVVAIFHLTYGMQGYFF